MHEYKYLKAADDGRNAYDVLELNEKFSLHDTKFIVHDEVKRNYLVFRDYEQYQNWFHEQPVRTLHEVIRGMQPQKLKFDIDAESAKLDLLPDIPMPIEPVIEITDEDWLQEIYDAAYEIQMREHEAAFQIWQSKSMRQHKADAMYDAIYKAIKEVFFYNYYYEVTDDDLAVSDSSDDTKFSRHIVVKSRHVANS
eukprot:TRINITY_DN6324_c0_g2_i2.p1 TRINITY_DN6324_c0_g2~~TRINITY_DN6324_c0_g2_i2.p1  ORF type:complete len:195 (-),score=27.57 TRINITY_DN6324_c0_g2_i2:697-1281(-)